MEDAPVRCGRLGTELFRLSYVGQYEPLKAWCAKNVTYNPAPVSKLAVKKLVARGTLTDRVAADCMCELWGR